MEVQLNRDVARRVLDVVDQGLVEGLGKPIPGQMCTEAAVCYALGLPHGDDPGCVSPALRELKIALNDKAWSSPAARAKGLRRLAIAQLGTLGEIDDAAFIAAVAEMTIRVMLPIALRAAAGMPDNAAHKDGLESAAARCEAEGTKAAADAADAAAAYAAAARRAAAAAAYAAAAYAAANAADAADAAYAAAAAAANAADAADAAYAAAAAAAYAAAAAAAAYAAAAAAYDKRDSILSLFAEQVVQILIKLGVRATAWLDLAPLDGEK